MRFLDTNVLLRYLTRDDLDKADACMALLQSVTDGEEEILTSETVIAEVFYVLTRSRGGYQVDRLEVVAGLRPIVAMSGLQMPNKGLVERAFSVYEAYPNLDFEDALSVAHMEAAGITEIVSYDRGFDRVDGLVRVEPGAG